MLNDSREILQRQISPEYNASLYVLCRYLRIQTYAQGSTVESVLNCRTRATCGRKREWLGNHMLSNRLFAWPSLVASSHRDPVILSD
jgi:hypothetical protein